MNSLAMEAATLPRAAGTQIRRCPRCGLADVHRSHAKGLLERAVRSTGRKWYRCEACNWRGWRIRRVEEVPTSFLAVRRWLRDYRKRRDAVRRKKKPQSWLRALKMGLMAAAVGIGSGFALENCQTPPPASVEVAP